MSGEISALTNPYPGFDDVDDDSYGKLSRQFLFDNDERAYFGRLTADSVKNNVWTFSQPWKIMLADEVLRQIELEPLQSTF